MSLMRQLWLAVVISTVLAFSGSLLISIWSARAYLAEQLERKNSDNANSLALSMTQQEKDPVMIELQVSALFDTGYYQSISVVDPHGKVIAERIQNIREAHVPGWFEGLFPIESRPGMAQISAGWKQYGTVKVVSHNQFAYRALWDQAGQLLLWFGLGGSLMGGLGMLMLRTIGRSLGNVVRQAGAIGERRFVTIEEPRIPELRALTHAMNGMVARIRQMFAEETGRLNELQRRVNYDALTGLPNREYFMAHFKEHLAGAEAAQFGVLAVMQLHDLNDLNQALGRAGTDRLLTDIGAVFANLAEQHANALAGRIKAGDIALVIPGENDVQDVGQRLVDVLTQRLTPNWPSVSELFHLGVVGFTRGDGIGVTLSRADQALASASDQVDKAWFALANDSEMQAIPGEQWRALLTRAAYSGHLHLAFYPVEKREGGLVHQEGLIRLQGLPDGGVLTAGDFIPMAAHLKLTALIDLEAIKLALQHLATIQEDVAVNLSAETIHNWGFRNELSELLGQYPDRRHRLWFEVPEYGAFKHFDAFKDLCRTIKKMGGRVGVEHFGLRLSESHQITELGLDYVKIHPSLVRDIEQNAGSQQFIERFCGVAHSVGITVIATGVQSQAELAMLNSLGVDGATGPAIGK